VAGRNWNSGATGETRWACQRTSTVRWAWL
jgi:hypothetical protein